MADLLNVPRSTGDDLNHYYFLYLPFNLEDQIDSKGDNPFFIMNYKGDPSDDTHVSEWKNAVNEFCSSLYLTGLNPSFPRIFPVPCDNRELGPGVSVFERATISEVTEVREDDGYSIDGETACEDEGLNRLYLFSDIKKTSTETSEDTTGQYSYMGSASGPIGHLSSVINFGNSYTGAATPYPASLNTLMWYKKVRTSQQHSDLSAGAKTMSFQFALVRNGNTAVPGITNFDKIGIKVYPRDFVLLSIDNNNINGTEKINGITFNEYRFKIHGTNGGPASHYKKHKDLKKAFEYMFAEGSFGVLSWDIFVPKQGMRADGYRSESNIVKIKKYSNNCEYVSILYPSNKPIPPTGTELILSTGSTLVNIDVTSSIKLFDGKDIKSSSSTNQTESVFTNNNQWKDNGAAEHMNIVKAELLNAVYGRNDLNPFHGETSFCSPQKNIIMEKIYSYVIVRIDVTYNPYELSQFINEDYRKIPMFIGKRSGADDKEYYYVNYDAAEYDVSRLKTSSNVLDMFGFDLRFRNV